MKRKLFAILCIVVLFVAVFLNINIEAKITTIFISAISLWLFVDTKWTTLLILLSLAMIPQIGVNYVVKNSFGNNIILFLMMSFILTYAFFKTNYTQKITYYLINTNFSKKSSVNFVLMLLLSAFFIGCFVSPTVLFIVYLPLIETIFKTLDIDKQEGIYKLTVMALVFVCGITSGMTPISHVFPVISIGIVEKYLNISISYTSYMIIGVSVGIICFIFMFLMLKHFYQRDFEKFNTINFSNLKDLECDISKKDKYVLSIFLLTIILWIGPDLFEFFIKNNHLIKYFKTLSISFPPLLAVCLLTAIEVDKQKLLDFEDAFKNGIHWPSIFICATTLLFGSLLTNPDFNITNNISIFFQNNLYNLSEMVIVGILLLWCLLQTNFSSNIVASTLVSSLAVGIYKLGIVNFDLKVTACLIGMLSAYAFATPSAMPSVAIVVGKSYVKAKEIFIFGMILALFSVLVCMLFAYPLGKIIL